MKKSNAMPSFKKERVIELNTKLKMLYLLRDYKYAKQKLTS